MKDKWHKPAQAACFIAYLALSFRNLSKLAETEFSGGWLTGRLLALEEVGSLVFLMAILVTIFFLRVAAALGIAASVLCLPLHLYLIAPGLYQKIFHGEYKVPSATIFVWSNEGIAGVLILALAIYLCIGAFAMKHKPAQPPT